MKKYTWFGWTLVAIMTGASFTACTNETEEVFTQSNEIKLTSAITPASRVANQLMQSTQIVTAQEVGVTITGAKSEHNNVKWLAEEDGSLTNTGNTLYWGSSDVNIMAYHPFNQDWSGTTHNFSVDTDQSSDKNYLNCDLLWVKTTASKSSNPIGLQFAHKLAKIMVGIQHEDGATDVTSAIVSICGTKPSATFNLSTGEITNPSGDASDIKAAQAASAAAIIIPQTVNAGTKFIKVEFNEKTFYYTLSENKTFESGKAYGFTLTLKEKGTELTLTSPESNGNITDWDNENNGTTGDANESIKQEDINGDVIIENTELSQALLNVLGSEKVAINNSGYAVMSEEDVNDITDLNFGEYQGNITTLNGIEHFVNLEYLNCGIRPSLTTCDLSQNSTLISFDVTESGITSLDFSNNPNLKAVHCNGNEELASLNLTGCTQLSDLQIFSTAITTNSLTIPDDVKAAVDNLLYSGTSLVLDLNDFPNLESLGCIDMGLTTLNGYIPETYKSKLTVLICDNNQLTEVNLAEYPNLRTLSCYYNKIENLDPSQAPYLQNLSCFGNKISTIDISTNSDLTDWRCGDQTGTNDESTTIQVTVNATQKSAYEKGDNGLNEWGNNNIQLILAE